MKGDNTLTTRILTTDGLAQQSRNQRVFFDRMNWMNRMRLNTRPPGLKSPKKNAKEAKGSETAKYAKTRKD